MRWCSLCKKKFAKGKGQLFRLPKSANEKKKWSEICRINFKPSALICSEHFLPSSIINVGGKSFLLPNAEPFVSQFQEPHISTQAIDFEDLITTRVAIKVKSCPLDEPSPSLSCVKLEETEQDIEQFHKEELKQTESSTFSMDGKQLLQRIRTLEVENIDLKCKLHQANAAVDALRRNYILARNTGYLNGRGNNMEENTAECLNILSTSREIPNALQMSHSKEFNTQDIDEELFTEINEDAEVVELNRIDENFCDIDILGEDALEYVAGYIIKKLHLEEYECHETSFSWVDQVSNGSFKKPNATFLAELRKLESIFYNVNGKEISHSSNLEQRLLALSINVNLPDEAKKMFFKCRIYFRVRDLHKRQKSNQKYMVHKKLMQIIK